MRQESFEIFFLTVCYFVHQLSTQNVLDDIKDERICERYNGTFCSEFIFNSTLYNDTYVDRNSSRSIQRTEDALKKLFLMLEGSECKRLAKWFGCASEYSPCSFNSSETSFLPCQSVCTLMRDRVCIDSWPNLEKLEKILYGQIVLPSCEMFPTSGKCRVPSFIKDVLPHGDDKENDSMMEIIIGSVCGSVTLLLCVVIFVWFLKRQNRRREVTKSVFMDEITEVHRAADHSDRYAMLDSIEHAYSNLELLVDGMGLKKFSRDQLQFERKLGEGAFGKVVQCKIPLPTVTSQTNMAAVKYLKQNASSEMEQYFCKEIEILSHFNHPNVIPLLGVCIQPPYCLVLEFMKHGDLNDYIRTRAGSYHAVAGSCGNLPDGIEFRTPELSFHNLLLIIRQIADGLDYLARNRFVHRDIATRNILVGDDLLVKISDFGLAHDVYGSDYYIVDTQKMLPLRWLSPEALSLGRFTVYSDIWAFGVTMWEIFSYGMQPFYGCGNDEVCQRIRCMKIPARPYCCPNKVYDLMKSCWKFEPTQRKDAAYIRDTIISWVEEKQAFIETAWQRLLLPPLPDRIPTIKKAKMKYLNIRTEITL